jgi:hypothetical protein
MKSLLRNTLGFLQNDIRKKPLEILKAHKIDAIMCLFVLINVVIRFLVIFNENSVTRYILPLIVVGCILLLAFSKWLKESLFLFGLCLPLFGSQSFFVYNHVFEFLLSGFTLILILLNQKHADSQKINKILLRLVLLYIILSTGSLVLLPIGHLSKIFSLWGTINFSSAVFFALPSSIFYPLAGINRLFLFFVFIHQLSKSNIRGEGFKFIFIGMLFGAVISSAIGILNQYNIITLDWYRLQHSDGRLQSFFLNPNWFSEFIAISIPFVLLGFVRKDIRALWIMFLLAILIMCEVAIILTGSRTGWVVYPLVLMTCWFFFYLSRKSEESGSKFGIAKILFLILKVSVTVPITIVISFFIIFQVLENPNLSTKISGILNKINQIVASSKNDNKIHEGKVNSPRAVEHSGLIRNRVSKITSPMTRKSLWEDSIQLIIEKPFYGLGYESYNWHKSILGKIPQSNLSKNRKLGRNFDTPHSTISQISISGGLIGLVTWFSIIGSMMFFCILEFKRTKDYFTMSLMLFVVSFHIYGLAQSMQYISVIWFTIFLGVGYCLTLNENLLPLKLKRFLDKWVLILTVLVLFGCGNYIVNHSSTDLAEKYDLQIYAQDQARDDFTGFYHQENWPDGKYRWSGRAGIIKAKGEGLVEVKYFCGHPDISDQPVTLSVSLDGNLIDQIEFASQRKITKLYFIPDSSPKKHEFLFEVSRTWSPLKSRVNVDSRELGVAVSKLRFVGNTLEKDIGFYQPEIWKGAFPEEGSRISPIQFRWTTHQASLVLTKKERVNGVKTFVIATHPDNRWYKPVTLKILSGGQILRELKMTNQWQKIELTQHELKDKRVLTFQVNRTWNPERYGVSNDNRSLGVAVAKLNSQ